MRRMVRLCALFLAYSILKFVLKFLFIVYNCNVMWHRFAEDDDDEEDEDEESLEDEDDDDEGKKIIFFIWTF